MMAQCAKFLASSVSNWFLVNTIFIVPIALCTDSLSSLHLLRNVTSTEKLVVEVLPILYHFCDIGGCEIYFSYVRSHSGVLGNDRVDQLVKETTGVHIDLPSSVLLSHFKHLAWLETLLAWNSEYLASSRALWKIKFFQTIF